MSALDQPGNGFTDAALAHEVGTSRVYPHHINPTFPIDPISFVTSLIAEVKPLPDTDSEPQSTLRRKGEFTRCTTAVKTWLEVKSKDYACRAIHNHGAGNHECMLDVVWWKDGPGEPAQPAM